MKKGFSLLEVIIYLSLVFIIVSVVAAFVFWLVASNSKNRLMIETLNSAERALEIMVFEIRSAESVYTPTATTSQISLQTKRHLPAGEDTAYLDFYLCGNKLCMKAESQDPVVLTPENMEVSNLVFTYIVSGDNASVKVDISVQNKNISGYEFSTALSSSISLRSY